MAYAAPGCVHRNEWSPYWGAFGGFAYIQRYSATDRPYGACALASDADWLS